MQSADLVVFALKVLYPVGRMTTVYEIDAQSTEPFVTPFARSLAPLTHSLAPRCSFRSRAPLRSLVSSLARSLAHSLPYSWEKE